MRLRLDPKWVVIGMVVAIVAWLALVPLVFLIWQSFMTPQTAATPAVFTTGNYRDAYESRETIELFANSVEFAGGAAVLALAVGTALAWMNERTNTPLKSLVYALSVVPLVIPSILFVVAWIMLASPKIGLVNLLLQHSFGTDHVFFDIYSIPGMIWVDGLHYAPIAFLLMSAAFRSMDPALEESAMMSGASILAIARRITLKLAAPAVAASFLILFVRAIESFESPALLGLPVGIEVFTSSIYEAIHRYPSDIGLASAYAVALLAITSGGIYWQSRLSGQSQRYSTVTGKGFRPRVMDLGPWRYLTAAFFICYALLALVLPFLVLVWSSLQRFYSVPSMAALRNVSLAAYRTVINYPSVGRGGLEQHFPRAHHGHPGHAAELGGLLDRSADQDSRALAHRQSRLDAARRSRARARPFGDGLLPDDRRRDLRHDLDPAHRLCDTLHALRHALQHHLDDPGPPGTRGIGGDRRRLLADELLADHAAAAEAGPPRRLDLHRHRIDPRAVELDPAL